MPSSGREYGPVTEGGHRRVSMYHAFFMETHVQMKVFNIISSQSKVDRKIIINYNVEILQVLPHKV